MEESPKITYFAQCVSCGKVTFKDLLDQDLRCEYCREVRTHAGARNGKRVKAEKKQTD
jgi:DNA-directed RNA polymerase subunit RPC12/RpoP